MKRKLIYVISIMLITASFVGCREKKAEVGTKETNEIVEDISQEENSNEQETEEIPETEQLDMSMEEMFSTTSADGGVCIDRYNGTEENAIVEIPSEIDGELVVELNSTFAWVETIKEVVIPDSVKVIGEATFMGCINLEKVTIGTGVEAVGESAFQTCDKLTRLEFSEGLIKIDYLAIQSCKSLEGINLPTSLSEIGEANFTGCSEKLVITAPSGSVAEEFAKTWEFDFKAK